MCSTLSVALKAPFAFATRTFNQASSYLPSKSTCTKLGLTALAVAIAGGYFSTKQQANPNLLSSADCPACSFTCSSSESVFKEANDVITSLMQNCFSSQRGFEVSPSCVAACSELTENGYEFVQSPMLEQLMLSAATNLDVGAQFVKIVIPQSDNSDSESMPLLDTRQLEINLRIALKANNYDVAEALLQRGEEQLKEFSQQAIESLFNAAQKNAQEYDKNPSESKKLKDLLQHYIKATGYSVDTQSNNDLVVSTPVSATVPLSNSNKCADFSDLEPAGKSRSAFWHISNYVTHFPVTADDHKKIAKYLPCITTPAAMRDLLKAFLPISRSARVDPGILEFILENHALNSKKSMLATLEIQIRPLVKSGCKHGFNEPQQKILEIWKKFDQDSYDNVMARYMQ